MTKRKKQRRKRSNSNFSQHQLDIIIPVFGQPVALQKCLRSINETKGDLDLQVTIVDDFSPEDDIKKLKAIYTYISHRVYS